MPASLSIIEKVLQFAKTRQVKKIQAQAQHLTSPIEKNNGLILLPVLAQPNRGPSHFREEFEPLILKEKEKSLDLFPFMLSVSPQGKENETPALSPQSVSYFPNYNPFSPLERRRQKLEAGLEIRIYGGEMDNDTMDSLLTFIPDYQKPLPALPLLEPDYNKLLPPIPEMGEEFTLFFDTICRNCGVEEGNTERGWREQDFEIWVDTEDCGYCRDGNEREVRGGLDIREADIM